MDIKCEAQSSKTIWKSFSQLKVPSIIASFLLLLLPLLFINKEISLYASTQTPEALNGLINHGRYVNDSKSCRSRLEYDSYHRGSGEEIDKYKPSEYFISKLRAYEELHERCTSQIEAHNTDCKYVVSVVPYWQQGLGNKMLALGSTFLYALLTDRVLLISREENVDKLFCEPFPRSSWLLPESMSAILQSLNDSTRLGHGPELSVDPDKCINYRNEAKFPELVYSYLSVDYNDNDTKFFCQETQDVLHDQTKWLFIRSNVYYLPGFYYVPSFANEMNKMFKQPQAIFHHISRYLFHPVNTAWDRTTRFYDAYLSQSSTVAGVQMRVPPHLQGVRGNYANEVLQCAMEKNILPVLNSTSEPTNENLVKKWVSAVVASLDQQHFDRLREAYLLSNTVDGTYVTVHQPSHEASQHTGDLEHDEKALMEIYLLSLSNVLITTPGSTFGYIAQGLGGLRPWLMWCGPGCGTEVCSRVKSLDPCFFSFRDYNCGCDEEKKLENVMPCEDAPIAPGVKLIPNNK